MSHETIYETLFVQARGELRTQLKIALRSGRTERRPRGSTRPKQARIAGMVSIAERPTEAADRAVPGHWEGDLIIEKGGKNQILTLVEPADPVRHALPARVPYDRGADRIAVLLAQLVRTAARAAVPVYHLGPGRRDGRPRPFHRRHRCTVYFCGPHSPWQRGSNENTNGLLRQYFPKGTDLSIHTQAELDAVANRLNRRPRQTLDWGKLIERLNNLILSQSVF